VLEILLKRVKYGDLEDLVDYLQLDFSNLVPRKLVTIDHLRSSRVRLPRGAAVPMASYANANDINTS
jgi:hypothetical protein